MFLAVIFNNFDNVSSIWNALMLKIWFLNKLWMNFRPLFLTCFRWNLRRLSQLWACFSRKVFDCSLVDNCTSDSSHTFFNFSRSVGHPPVFSFLSSVESRLALERKHRRHQPWTSAPSLFLFSCEDSSANVTPLDKISVKRGKDLAWVGETQEEASTSPAEGSIF